MRYTHKLSFLSFTEQDDAEQILLSLLPSPKMEVSQSDPYIELCVPDAEELIYLVDTLKSENLYPTVEEL